MSHNVVTFKKRDSVPASPNDPVIYSELFYSIEGEGLMAGQPTVFLRLFGCNLSCPSFGLRDGAVAVHDTPIESIEDVDKKGIASRGGCDSAYSWHPTYKNLRKTKSVRDISRDIWDLLPAAIRSPDPSLAAPIWVLSFTGGEPMLHQPVIAAIILELMDYIDEGGGELFIPAPVLLFETNGTIELGKALSDTLKGYTNLFGDEMVLFCVSPKLSNSGEKPEDTLKPKAFASLFLASAVITLKYVSDGSLQSIEEVKAATRMLLGTDSILVDSIWDDEDNVDVTERINRTSIFLMPEGSTSEELARTSKKVAEACLANGFSYSPRLHVDLFGNAVGT